MKYDFTPKGVCSRGIHVELDGDVIRSVKFDGGCNGNTAGRGSACGRYDR